MEILRKISILNFLLQQYIFDSTILNIFVYVLTSPALVIIKMIKVIVFLPVKRKSTLLLIFRYARQIRIFLTGKNVYLSCVCLKI